MGTGISHGITLTVYSLVRGKEFSVPRVTVIQGVFIIAWSAIINIQNTTTKGNLEPH